MISEQYYTHAHARTHTHTHTQDDNVAENGNISSIGRHPSSAGSDEETSIPECALLPKSKWNHGDIRMFPLIVVVVKCALSRS